MPLPLPWKPERGSAASYVKVREQARIQVQGRVEGTPLYETLPTQMKMANAFCRYLELARTL